MVEGPIGLHILWEDEGLLQNLGYQPSVPPAIMLEGGIICNWHAIYLQHERSSTGWAAHLGHRRLLSAIHRIGPSVPLVLRLPGPFASFGRAQLPLFSSLNMPFLP